MSSHNMSSYLLIEIKSLPKKIPSTPFIDNRFLINSLLVLFFLEISNEPLVETSMNLGLV